ncbi:MAG: cofactor-independent phosphoglycerate mutase [Kiritimatiellia bacterium]|jgi:2,3-bisphosphoglycerate-independent phosphoglycerate mutase|nr:cofactor-independent phosphoglycerate mutase [Kiritimatiellia bacterium]MDP6630241.1 cofactor-independent phosphoglycerate mutase [Kiritimatiellia bacterium]MDP6811510.1 cofactor-independent phosphoglycerate mutase [Kiritimatiellia bacterium]MDP7023770.1 cofactor-independent phosphoglycerate mutase [Kiritimatiellia bacterium]
MSNPKKTIIFLGDGMADEAIASLGNCTPLQAAKTPAMDAIAREGRSGTLLTLPKGFPTSSDVANMSVLGCELKTDYCGRGALEAAGRGIVLGPDDVAFRVNLVTTEGDILRDFSGGHVAPETAARLIDVLNDAFATPTIRFHSGVSYRNILVLSGSEFSPDIQADKPDDNTGNPVDEHLPTATNPAAEATAALLRRFIAEAPAVLAASDVAGELAAAGLPPVNGIWPWSGGRAGAIRTLHDKFGISSAVISAVDVITGLGICLGMTPIPVEGATGYIDTNYEGKADAAIDAIRTHDLVYLHVEAIDEVSHAQDLDLKLSAIEDFDRRVVERVLNGIGNDVRTAVLPDHPVPIRLGKHTRLPVPVAIRDPKVHPDQIMTFDEVACLDGALNHMRGPQFMEHLFGPAR